REYGDDVLDYEEVHGTSLPLPERLALFKCCEVFVLSSVREGLNLLPLEYIYTRDQQYKAGVVLASEFSACSSLLNGAVRINPFDVAKAAAAFDQALGMEDAERTSRRARDLPYISSRPSAEWTYQVMCDMWAMSNESTVTHVEETTLLDSDLTHEVTMTGFSELNTAEVGEVYRKSKRRVLIFDYGGSLLEKEGLGKYLKRNMASVSGRKLTPGTHEALRKLCQDEANTVFVVSGLHDTSLVEAVGDIEGLGLAANNGLSFSWGEKPSTLDKGDKAQSLDDAQASGAEREGMVKGRKEKKERSWEVFDYGVDWEEVKEEALPLLEKFTAHTNGSSIKIRDSGLTWSYYSCDPEWGQMQAKQLVLELEVALAAYDVKVQHVRGQLEVVPKRLHKGVVVKTILKKLQQKSGHYPDFMFCLGDDISDEQMFIAFYSFLADIDCLPEGSPEAALKPEADDIRVYTCTVGKKPTHASLYVNETREVEALVQVLAGT
ncbi:unnamed protein product, partial [Discosporangium mesarthrocarpum]